MKYNLAQIYIYDSKFAIIINKSIFVAMNDIDIMDLYERSDNSIASELGRRFKNYRIALRLTQKEVAEQSGVSVMTIVRFEKGDGGSIRLDTFISLMRAIQKLEGISESIPNMPTSIYDELASKRKQKQRVKKRADER